MPLEQLTRARIIEALNLLGHLAAQAQVTLERFYPHDALTTQARAAISGLLPKPNKTSQ